MVKVSQGYRRRMGGESFLMSCESPVGDWGGR